MEYRLQQEEQLYLMNKKKMQNCNAWYNSVFENQRKCLLKMEKLAILYEQAKGDTGNFTSIRQKAKTISTLIFTGVYFPK
jgi:hypothetical protein